MPNIDSFLRTLKGTGKPAAGILAIVTAVSLGLTACGGSSGSTASQTNAAAASGANTSRSTTGSSTGNPSSPGNGVSGAKSRILAIRECMQKNGITLPTPSAGASGPQLPKGMTRAQFEAALKKCGGSNFGAGIGRPNRPGVGRASGPVFRQALAKFSECLRQNGIHVPAPNTTGKGPVFNTKGLNTASPQFRAATMKCRGVLVAAFRAKR